jgi:hypothetical protein
MVDALKADPSTKGKAIVAEVLNDTSQDILTDFMMMECNNGTKHTHSIRTGLPSVAWGALYEGVPQSKAMMQQVDDTTGFVEGMASADTRLLKLAKKPDLIRATQAEPYIEAMSQELVTSFFYHNPATDARLPKGLGARYGKLSNSGIGRQIVDGGGTGSDNTSIWMVTWGDQGCCALYPEGTAAGIQQEDKGEQRVLDPNGNPYYVKEELITAHMGFAVTDWRRNVRIPNIDVSDLKAGSVDLYALLRTAFYRLHGRRVNKIKDQGDRGRTVMYCNTDIMEALDGLATNAGSTDNFTRLRPMEVEGKEVLTYRGIVIRETDALLNTEARIV